jgi:hypothetical protein
MKEKQIIDRKRCAHRKLSEIQNKIKSSMDDVNALVNSLQKSGIQVYEKQESMLLEFGEKVIKNVEGKLEKAKYQSEEVLDSITKAGNNLLEKQEEKNRKSNDIHKKS